MVWVVAGLVWVAPGGALELLSPVEIEAPTKVVVGSMIEIRWHGEIAKLDFISIDPVGAPESKYGKYVYPSRGMPRELRVPEVPGNYLIRYHAKSKGYPVRGSSPLEVIDATATIEGPLTVDSGASVEIHWTGPANRQDFISIDPVGSAEKKYGKYAYAKKVPAKIRAPEEPGQYIIRYHLAMTYRVIGQTELTVKGVTATLEAPAQVQAGGEIAVSWQGPGGQGDYISIDPPDSPARDYIQYRYTRSGSPAVIRIPEEAGRYEIRYHQGQKRTVLARIPLEVLANEATVNGPASAAGGSDFTVQWTGPNNSGDYITIVPEGARAREYLSYYYTKRGSPGTLEAPLEPGAYELRYMTGQSRGILARVAIEVTPGAVPGTLRVFAADGHSTPARPAAVEVILDASGSMLKRLDGERRIAIAKDALENLARHVIPAGTQFALRVFGHKEADSCRTDLEIPVAPLDAGVVVAKIQTIQAKNLAKTPIAASLAKVKEDLADISGPVTVVLLTDGEETCDGDPRAAIEALSQAGFDVSVNIVGFAINELALKEQFESWARIGNGRYIEAHDKEELREAINRSLDVPFEVLAGDDVAATGVVNGEAVSLLPGKYRVRILGSRPRDLGAVEIEARGEIDLRADEPG
jgi:hypothetical protein